MKVCTTCKRELPETIAFFHKDKLGKKGLRAECKDCKNAKDRKHQHENQEKKKEVQDKWKLKVMENSPLNITYSAIHRYMRENYEAPRNCQICHERKEVELANITGIYSRDIKDYMWLCKQCHISFDSKKEQPPSIKIDWGKLLQRMCSNDMCRCLHEGAYHNEGLYGCTCGCKSFEIWKQNNPSEQEAGLVLQDECKYWEKGHLKMNCKECRTPNQNYCIHKFKEKETTELDMTANIERIIEIYDNGHENVFYPDTHMVIKKADLEKWLEELVVGLQLFHFTAIQGFNVLRIEVSVKQMKDYLKI